MTAHVLEAGGQLVLVQGAHVRHLVEPGASTTVCGQDANLPAAGASTGTRSRVCKRCQVLSVKADAKPVKGPGGRTPLLTLELQEELLGYVERGAYQWVAAGAVGVSPSTLNSWLRKGEDAETRQDQGMDLDERDQLYLEFMRALRQAHLRARARAEVRVNYDDPFRWLRYGPGRERPGEPGWTESHQVTGPEGGPVLPTDGDEAVAEAARAFLAAKAAGAPAGPVEPTPEGLPRG